MLAAVAGPRYVRWSRRTHTASSRAFAVTTATAPIGERISRRKRSGGATTTAWREPTFSWALSYEMCAKPRTAVMARRRTPISASRTSGFGRTPVHCGRGRAGRQPAAAPKATTRTSAACAVWVSAIAERRSRALVTRPRSGSEQLELALQAVDLLRLLGLVQRLRVDANRLARTPDLLVGVAEMLGHGGILAGELDGVLQRVDGALVVAALVVHPRQRVDVEAVVRLDGERAPDQALGLVETVALLRVGVAEVVERRRVLRVDRDRPLHQLDRLRLVLRLVVEGAKREDLLVVVLVERHGLFQRGDRLRVVLLLAVDGAHVAQEVRV